NIFSRLGVTYGEKIRRARSRGDYFLGRDKRSDASAPDLAAALRDQPRGALIPGVDPEPAQRHAEAIAQAYQEIDVGDAPYPPRQRPLQFDAAEIDHRLLLADLRQAAGML